MQCHSDGGFRRPGLGAAAYTLSVLSLDATGALTRRLLVAEGVFIQDVKVTAPDAERIALTMSIRALYAFIQRASPINFSLLCAISIESFPHLLGAEARRPMSDAFGFLCHCF